MGSSKQSLVKLSAIIEQHSANQTDMPFRNMFATACYLSVIGEDRAARKQVKSLFDWLGWDERRTYFSAILESLSEFAPKYASEIAANQEINKIFYKAEAPANSAVGSPDNV
ncbi:MAG: hypothetical protein JJU03_01760 [Idiomarina sp.]|nr:hypothetical protein [Idiomarina sp.]